MNLGWRTALLGAAVLHCLCIALALIFAEGNRSANRFLAGALAVLAGLLLPYALGFAGAYDAFRWLTFAPFAVPLALGPLLYLYSRSLGGRAKADVAVRHLALPAAQVMYFTVCFMLPAPLKWDWYTGGHRAWVSPVFDFLALVSLAIYAWATWRFLGSFRARLADQRSDDDRFAAIWLSRVVVILLAGLTLEVGFWLWSIGIGGTNFFQETGLYLGLGVLSVYLGVAGWRHAALPMPLENVEADPPAPAEMDWRTIAADIQARTISAEWWKDPTLSVTRLAKHLGTNSGRVSRAVNAGLGVNFSVFVNNLRAEAVAAALDAGRRDDLLSLALEMGFASKASFNRAFSARYGVTPSAYRAGVSNPDSLARHAEMRRGPGSAAAE